MSDILAIVDRTNTDEELVEEIARSRPDKVTVLVHDENADWAEDESPRGRALRDRLALLLAEIERQTGAVVIGLAGSSDQLSGWRFDRVVAGGTVLTGTTPAYAT